MEQSDGKEGDKQQDNSKQIEEYSEGVKKRIAKLTKRMREAERQKEEAIRCLLYTSPSPRDKRQSRMPSSA